VATGRIGVTPTLGVRWSKAPTGGTTSLSGLDDNSVSLVYSVGYEQVYRNGVLLSRGNDYTATDGTTVTLIDATITGDIIEIFAQQLVPLTDAISKGQFTAKGALLSATAASTPGVLAVGANDTVLTADSTTSTGLKWATPAAGGMTLLSTTSLSGSSTTISSISGSYINLFVMIKNLTQSASNDILVKFNTSQLPIVNGVANGVAWSKGTGEISPNPGTNPQIITFTINNYSDASFKKSIIGSGYSTNTTANIFGGYIADNNAITDIVISCSPSTFSAGSVLIYGVK
jgi:hypothetical protein